MFSNQVVVGYNHSYYSIHDVFKVENSALFETSLKKAVSSHSLKKLFLLKVYLDSSMKYIIVNYQIMTTSDIASLNWVCKFIHPSILNLTRDVKTDYKVMLLKFNYFDWLIDFLLEYREPQIRYRFDQYESNSCFLCNFAVLTANSTRLSISPFLEHILSIITTYKTMAIFAHNTWSCLPLISRVIKSIINWS